MTIMSGTFTNLRTKTVPIVSEATAWPDVSTWSLDTIPIEYNVSGASQGIVGCVWNDTGTRLYCTADAGGGTSVIWRNTPDYSTPYVPVDDTSPENVVDPGTGRHREMAWASDGTEIISANLNTQLDKLVASGAAWTPYNPENGEVSTTVDQSFTVGGSRTPRSIDISPDGKTMWYVSNTTGRDIYEVTLTVAYDLSTASDGNSYAPPQEDMLSMKFSPDGLSFYALGLSGVLYEYTCSTEFDITSASYSGNSLNVLNSRIPASVDVSFDATKMVVAFFNTTSTANELATYTV